MKSAKDQFEIIVDDLFAEAKRDYVGLWQIVSRLSRFEDPPTGLLLQRNVLFIVARLLERGLEPGQLATAGGFERWTNEGSTDVLERIANEWKELSHAPGIGDICWFNLKQSDQGQSS